MALLPPTRAVVPEAPESSSKRHRYGPGQSACKSRATIVNLRDGVTTVALVPVSLVTSVRTRCSLAERGRLQTFESVPAHPAGYRRSDWPSGPSISRSVPAHPAGYRRSDWPSGPSISRSVPAHPAGYRRSDWLGMAASPQGAWNALSMLCGPILMCMLPRHFRWQPRNLGR